MKQIITIIIIVVALGAAGYFGYKAITSTSPSSTTALTTQSRILPFGTDLDFSSVKKYNKDGKIFQYPVVSPDEIGPELNTVIK